VPLVQGRDTQKTQHGIETKFQSAAAEFGVTSRHSENPARD